MREKKERFGAGVLTAAGCDCCRTRDVGVFALDCSIDCRKLVAFACDGCIGNVAVGVLIGGPGGCAANGDGGAGGAEVGAFRCGGRVRFRDDIAYP